MPAAGDDGVRGESVRHTSSDLPARDIHIDAMQIAQLNPLCRTFVCWVVLDFVEHQHRIRAMRLRAQPDDKENQEQVDTHSGAGNHGGVLRSLFPYLQMNE